MTDKYKVAYILGAGASCKNNALPTVAKFSEALQNCGAFLRRQVQNDRRLENPLSQWCNDLERLANLGLTHNTVDSYAKWCSRNDPGQLQKVKKTLSLFFHIQQFILLSRDPRYSQFITELIDNEFVFPENIKIINWNYDSQMQLACQANRKKEKYGFGASGKNRHIKGIINYYPTMSDIGNLDDKFDMVHMNGIAGFLSDPFSKGSMTYTNANDGITNLPDLIDILQKHERFEPIFNFAFETSENGRAIDDRINIAQNLIKNTDILVVIGYSFPAVNDPIDRILFQKMIKSRLMKLYIQSPGVSSDTIRTRFNIPDRTIIERVEQLESFHIALEYQQEKPKFGVKNYLVETR